MLRESGYVIDYASPIQQPNARSISKNAIHNLKTALMPTATDTLHANRREVNWYSILLPLCEELCVPAYMNWSEEFVSPKLGYSEVLPRSGASARRVSQTARARTRLGPLTDCEIPGTRSAGPPLHNASDSVRHASPVPGRAYTTSRQCSLFCARRFAHGVRGREGE